MSSLPKELPNMEHEFVLEVQGDTTGKKFVGEFKYRIPNLKAKCLADKKRAELNSGFEEKLDPSVLHLHYMISYLRFSLTRVPQWWEEADYGYNLYDFNVVEKVFREAEAFEAEWMKQVWGEENVGQNSPKS